jgi:hypothetical protein
MGGRHYGLFEVGDESRPHLIDLIYFPVPLLEASSTMA